MPEWHLMTGTVLAISFFFQAEDGIRDRTVTGVQTCALPILIFAALPSPVPVQKTKITIIGVEFEGETPLSDALRAQLVEDIEHSELWVTPEAQIGRASCRERVESSVVGVGVKERSA